ncbi:MAG TPA: hypothetical protein VJ032_10265 [Thermoanaerobaculia bacterium]|nr:hypothetical protein [Thermoanaerobaculia bacterium]
MSASSLLKSLSDEQKAILAAKKVTLNRPADELLTLLKPIAAFDTAAAPARKKAGCWAGALFPIGIIGIFIALGQDGAVRLIMLGVAAALIVVAIVMTKTYRTLKAADVSDNLAAVVIPLLTILREDVPAAEPVSVDIDLTAAESREKRTNVIEPKSKGYPKITTSFYSDPWFEGSTVFADGTHVAWEVIDRLRVTKKTKKNPRGKIKTKSKSKLRSDVRVKLGFPTKRFAPTRGEVAADAKRYDVKLAKRSQASAESPQAFRMLIDVIADGYRSVEGNKGGAR